MNIWYLGPLGDLRPLVCPEPGISIKEVRYGGIHQGLSGARTMDVTGHRSEYSFNFTYLDQAEWVWLDALHTRHIPGPFRLINPLKHNRLSLQATKLTVSTGDRVGVRLVETNTYVLSRDWPSAVPIPGRSLKMSGWAGTDSPVVFDPARPLPIMQGETITASIYVKSAAPHAGAALSLNWFDVDGVAMSPTLSPTFSLTTAWARQSMVGKVPPAGAAGCTLTLWLGAPDTTIYAAAPQVEAGALAEWESGGGAPEVLLDQLEATSPRFPLRDASLTLLEA